MFKVGDIVRIRKDSHYFNLNRDNPGYTNGKIIGIDSDFGIFSILVKWEKEYTNFYRECDLELAQSYIQQEEAKKLLGLK